MSPSRGTRGRVIAIAAIAAWIAIGAGAAQTFYVRILIQDRAAIERHLRELPYSQIPGFRTLLFETDRRTPPGARVLIGLPFREWQRGYGYGFRRAQYLLQGKEAIPLLDRATGTIDDSAIHRADYVLCWRECPAPPGFTPIFRNADGILMRSGQ